MGIPVVGGAGGRYGRPRWCGWGGSVEGGVWAACEERGEAVRWCGGMRSDMTPPPVEAAR